jgi:hypothetical protein
MHETKEKSYYWSGVPDVSATDLQISAERQQELRTPIGLSVSILVHWSRY